MMKRKKSLWLKAGVIAFLCSAGVMAFLVLPSHSQGAGKDLAPEGGALYPENNYGWLTLYMHHVYTRYTEAKKSFDKGDMVMADADLVVMELFVEASQTRLPDKLQNGQPFDKKAYQASMKKLVEHSTAVRGNLKNKKWADAAADKSDPMMATCVGCHKAYNIPKDFRIEGPLKVLTHVMHQVYDIYHLAGAQLQKEKWDIALAGFRVCRPYIETIPANIPATNQDGQKLDKELFMTTYKQLKGFNDDKIKQLETKSFMGGKPLPPPRVVMDNCKACHANAKIESPW
jgi:hypothetical protein